MSLAEKIEIMFKLSNMESDLEEIELKDKKGKSELLLNNKIDKIIFNTDF